MLFLFRSAPEVEKRIHSKLFRKFWRSRGTKEPAYITVLCVNSPRFPKLQRQRPSRWGWWREVPSDRGKRSKYYRKWRQYCNEIIRELNYDKLFAGDRRGGHPCRNSSLWKRTTCREDAWRAKVIITMIMMVMTNKAKTMIIIIGLCRMKMLDNKHMLWLTF